MPRDYDVIIVGLGAIGVAACSCLARRGARVLGIERYGIPHALGSSHGETRVIRLCYYEHPDYVPLLQRAYELWGELERESGASLMQLTGGLYMGPPESAFIQSTLRSAREHDLPHEELKPDAIATRYPQFRLPPDHIAVYEPRAGFLRPERIVGLYAERALRDGATLLGHERTLGWDADGAMVSVRTERTTYRSRHLILSAGAWSAALAGEIGVPLTATRQIAGWVWPRSPEHFEIGRMPIWGIDDVHGYFYYGFPLTHDRPGLKIARHHQGPVTDPEHVDRNIGPDDAVDIRRAARYLPEADGPLLSLSVCMYTNTPDGHFILDRHPAHPNVTVAAGFSGHGFKFASVLGEVMADLALDGGTRHPVAFLGLHRFAEGVTTPDVRGGTVAPERRPIRTEGPRG